MNNEEYKTIREEMLLRFRWTFEVIFFSIISTSAIISWLYLNKSEIINGQTNSLNTLGSPFLYIVIGLGIVAYLFSFYYNTLKGIYEQGSYLMVFHELETDDFKFHTLSRFQDKILPNQEKWGRDGRNAAYLMILLCIVNIFGPLYLLWDNIFPNEFIDTLLFLIFIGLLVISGLIINHLFATQELMYTSLNNWLNIKEKMLKDKLFVNATKYNKNLEEKIKVFLNHKDIS